MKLSTAVDMLRTPNSAQIAPLLLLLFSLILIFYYLLSIPSLFSDLSSSAAGGGHLTANSTLSSPPSAASLLKPRKLQPPPGIKVFPRMGILDETGAMATDFEIGEFDSSFIDDLRNLSGGSGGGEEKKKAQDDDDDDCVRIKYGKYKVCEEIKIDYVPCLNLSDNLGKFERHCPEEGKGLDCLLPVPKGYRKSVPWPKSRDEVWFSNVPHTRLVEDDKGGQNSAAIQGDKFIFPGGGKQSSHGVGHYLDHISQIVPDVAFGRRTRVALDIGCGVANFGAFLLQRNVTTLSIGPKDVHEKNQIQFAIERGVPAMGAVFSSRHLLYPSQAFDLIHCSRCMTDWTSDDGNYLLEANRILRAGGYFVWTAEPVYKHEETLQENWRDMENLTSKICWELVKKEGSTGIWRKPSNNSCYLNRDTGAQPPLCNSSDDPDNVWCEPFDTYPRTYDLIHAASLFSVEQKRKKCKISSIMLEMDRMQRFGGTVYIRDTVSVLVELQEIATAMGWVAAIHDTGEGPHASLKFLICEKHMP